MCIIVCTFQAFDSHVRVDLCRRKAGVTKKRLHAPQVRAGIEEVRRKTVTKFVRTDTHWDACMAKVTFEQEPDRTS